MASEIIGKTLAGKYRIESILKEKDGLLVCSGKQISLEKAVTIKLFPARLTALLTQEIRSLARLSHPNIAGLIDYGEETDGTIFFITEAIEGKSLKQIILENQLIELKRVNNFIQQIASALITAHANGVVHGRLNSHNIYVITSPDEKEIVKIFEFGSANSLITTEEAHYLAPEQFYKNASKDTRSDIYSLGIITYELLTGRLPFSGKDLEEIKQKHLKEPALAISSFRSDVSDELEAVVQRTLAKSPDNRFQTVKGFSDSFDFVVKFAQKKSNVGSVVETRPYENNPWKTAFIVLSGIILIGSFFIYLTQVKQTIPPTLPVESNSLPVQPLNPATGMTEQSLSNMAGFENLSNTNLPTNIKPEATGSGDPWSRGAFVPPPSGLYYDGNVNPESPFMGPDGNVYILIPKNANINAVINANTSNSPVTKNTNTSKATTNNTSTPIQKPSSTPTPNSDTSLQNDKQTSSPTPTPKSSPKTIQSLANSDDQN